MENSSVFGLHPSEKLQKIFLARPFQIQEPEKAKFIFLGFDANLDLEIEKNDYFFNIMLQYLNDGVEYWKRNNYHTPMLNPEYKGAGKRYHNRFVKLGFSKDNAEDICFIELLKYCTYGNSCNDRSLYMEILHSKNNNDHLERIKNIVGLKNIICIPKGVKTLIDKENLFDTNKEKIYIHTHLSRISNMDLFNMKLKLKKYL